MGKQGLQEYDNNILISALPDLLPLEEVIDRLTEDFLFDDTERRLPPHLRLHAVMRLARFFTPLSQHLALYSSIMLALRQGYIGRHPGTVEYSAYRQVALARFYGEANAVQTASYKSNACSFAFLGCSGTGKSYSVLHILRSIGQTIPHVEPVSVVQVAWLYVECPHKGNLKGLCLRIFAALDEALKTTTYRRDYGYRRATVEEMLLDIQQLFTIHAVGLLVIDEIQNLREAHQTDKSAITRFFVLLVNSVGVPVISVGTLGAVSVFNSVFSNARRASGLGSIIWYPLPRGKDAEDEWPDFVRQLWRGQWTATPTELTSAILDAFYDETQGVLDLLVILYMLCQIQLVLLTAMAQVGNPTAQPDETITVDLIRAVAAEKFQLVQPILTALRDGRRDTLADLDDLREFHEAMELEFSERMKALPKRRTLPPPTGSSPRVDGERASHILSGLGLAPDISEAMVAELASHGDVNVASLLLEAGTILSNAESPAPKRKRTPSHKSILNENDLRQIVKASRAHGLSAHDGLTSSGYCAPILEDFPW
jgi:hypothetical protein